MAFLEHDIISSKNRNGHVAGQHDGKRDQGNGHIVLDTLFSLPQSARNCSLSWDNERGCEEYPRLLCGILLVP